MDGLVDVRSEVVVIECNAQHLHTTVDTVVMHGITYVYAGSVGVCM